MNLPSDIVFVPGHTLRCSVLYEHDKFHCVNQYFYSLLASKLQKLAYTIYRPFYQDMASVKISTMYS